MSTREYVYGCWCGRKHLVGDRHDLELNRCLKCNRILDTDQIFETRDGCDHGSFTPIYRPTELELSAYYSRQPLANQHTDTPSKSSEAIPSTARAETTRQPGESSAFPCAAPENHRGDRQSAHSRHSHTSGLYR